MQVRSLCWEDPLEEDMATYSRILAWKIPMDRGASRGGGGGGGGGYSPQGHTQSDTTEVT